MWSKLKLQGANLEIFRFTCYISMPILLMFYVGYNTDSKLNVPDFWPDPARLNQIPKDRVELKREIERMRQAREAKRVAKEAAAAGNTDDN